MVPGSSSSFSPEAATTLLLTTTTGVAKAAAGAAAAIVDVLLLLLTLSLLEGEIAPTPFIMCGVIVVVEAISSSTSTSIMFILTINKEGYVVNAIGKNTNVTNVTNTNVTDVKKEGCC